MINNNIIDSDSVCRIIFDFGSSIVTIHRNDGTALSVTWKEFTNMQVV